jgi:hypothetical protein
LYRCVFFSGLVVMSLIYTILFTRSQPKILAASKIQLMDRASSMVFRPSVSSNEFHLAPMDDGDKADDDVVVPDRTDAEDATTRDISVPKVAVKGGSRTNTGRPSQLDYVKPFQVDAFEALRMYESGMAFPTTGNNRKERKDTKEKKRKKTENNVRPQRNKKDTKEKNRTETERMQGRNGRRRLPITPE